MFAYLAEGLCQSGSAAGKVMAVYFCVIATKGHGVPCPKKVDF